MNNQLISWLSAKTEVHNISGVDKPETWLYQESNGVYYPYKPIEYQLYTGKIYRTLNEDGEQFTAICISNEYALQLFNEGIHIWEGHDGGESLIDDFEDLEHCFKHDSSPLFINYEDNSELLPHPYTPEPKEENSPVITFEESDHDLKNYNFTYTHEVNDILTEADGSIETYRTGRGVEFKCVTDNITIDFEDSNDEDLQFKIYNEVMNAFYNQVRI